MAVLTRQQLMQDAQNAGFSGPAQQIIVAIAYAESGANTDAVNPNDPYGGSFGVLQINGAHFSGETTQACALDAQCAFGFAYQLSHQGTDFHDWSTFTNGLYQQYLTSPVDASALPTSPQSSQQKCTCPSGYSPFINGIGKTECRNNSFPFDAHSCNEQTSSDPLTKIGQFLDSITALTDWLKDPIRIVKLVVGILLIGLAIFLLTSPQGQIARQVTSFSKEAGLNRIGGKK